MKDLEYLGSIQSGTNKIISESHSDFAGIREGSHIKFHEDHFLCTVVKSEKFPFESSFERIDSSRIKIGHNVEVNLAPSDTINLTFDEFEVATVFEIVFGGSGYSRGDAIFASGGEHSKDHRDNQIQKAQFEVTDVDAMGSIKFAKIVNRGKFHVAPEKLNNVQGGSGSGAQLKLEYRISPNKTTFQRDILEIDRTSEVLKLTYDLPEGIKSGTIWVDKWILTLSQNYHGPTKLNKDFDVIRDFSPIYGFSLMPKRSFSFDLIYNNFVLAAEEKIKKLEERIETLERKVIN